MTKNSNLTFNSSLEVGLRSLSLLRSAYPKCMDLNHLVLLDFIVTHTDSFGGLPSLHSKNRYKPTELLVRRPLIEEGLKLLAKKGLIEVIVTDEGFFYIAGDSSNTFFGALMSEYYTQQNARSDWVVDKYGNLNFIELKSEVNKIFEEWIEEFHSDIDEKLL
jgi:hypothetical protein